MHVHVTTLFSSRFPFLLSHEVCLLPPFCRHLSWAYLMRERKFLFFRPTCKPIQYVCMKELWWTFGDSIASGMVAKHTLLSLRYLKVILVTPSKCPLPGGGSLDILIFCCNYFHSGHLRVVHSPVASYLSSHLSREEPNKLFMYF